MGGVRPNMMFTWAMMLIGTLALIGFGIPGTDIGFAGFFSKGRHHRDGVRVDSRVRSVCLLVQR